MPMPEKKPVPLDYGYPGMPVNDKTPEINDAWRYFNEEMRPRREKVDDGYRKVEFGKPGGELFPIWTTMPQDLVDFGLGVAMYFQTLQLLMATFLLCYLTQLGTVSYYKSEKYSGGQADVKVGMLVGSAVCTDTEMVCLDDGCSTVATHNSCTMSDSQATADFSMTILLLLLFTAVGFIQSRMSIEMDESRQTAQDYSVMVDDPGAEDTDPEEWRKFFSRFGHVTFITVAKDNGKLLKALAARRAAMREIMMKIGNGTGSKTDGILGRTWDGQDFQSKIAQVCEQEKTGELSTDTTARRRAQIEKLGALGMKTMEKLKGALEKSNEALQEALDEAHEQKYVPSKIFVTFETEQAQRLCLQKLTRGLVPAAFDMGKDKMEESDIFNGNVLAVKEAPEPSEVFWEDVDVGFKTRMKQQTKTWIIVLFLVFGSLLLCKGLASSIGAGGAALWITVANIAMPMILRTICTSVEDHVSANDQNMSLFLKLTFFRWCNTAIVIYVITNFDEFLTEKAMKQVQAVILADAITSPLIRTLNPADLINQLIVCKYAPTQEKMNSYFMGTPWYPAERYADMTKTLFLSLFYSSLFPFGLFLTCFGYTFIFIVDKYSLLRSWRTTQQVDDDMMKVSRMHMMLAVYCHAVMSMVFYSEFPFDGVCPNNGKAEGIDDYDDGSSALLPTTMSHDVFMSAKAMYNVTTNQIYHRCDQSVGSRLLAIVFVGDRILENPTATGKQERAVKMYGVLVVTLTVLLFLAFFGKGVVMGIYNLFYGVYTSDGTEAKEDHFSKVDGIEAYIPLIRHNSLAYPLVATDLVEFDSKYLSFEMSSEDEYKMQCLFNQAELPSLSKDDLQDLFSVVKYYAPSGNLDSEGPKSKSKAKKKTKKGDKKGDYEAV